MVWSLPVPPSPLLPSTASIRSSACSLWSRRVDSTSVIARDRQALSPPAIP